MREIGALNKSIQLRNIFTGRRPNFAAALGALVFHFADQINKGSIQ